MTIIAVFGASGNIGAPLLTSLSSLIATSESDCKVRAISRSPEKLKSASRLCESIEYIHGDITEASSLREALLQVERVFLCLPQSLSSKEMITVNESFADIAGDLGVKHVVRISSYGIDDHIKGNGISQGPLGEAHIHGEKIIIDAGLSLTSIRPTSFSSNFIHFDLPQIRAKDSFSSPLGTEAAVNWVSCEDIALVAAHALLDASLDGRVLNVTGPPSSTLTAFQFQVLRSKFECPDYIPPALTELETQP